MPPLPYVTSQARVDLEYTDGVSTFGSRFFVTYGPVPPSEADCNAYSGVIKGLWTDNMAPLINQDYGLQTVTTTDIGASSGNEGSWHGLEVGGLTDAPLSSNVSADADLNISSRYRGGHPVMHFPPPGASELSNPRQFTSDFKTEFDTAVNNFLQAINGAEMVSATPTDWVILRGYRPGATEEEVQIFQVNSAELRRYVGTMRRRARALR